MAKSIREECRRIAEEALRVGTIQKPEHCQQCGRVANLKMRHKQYFFPLLVTWLCDTCYRQMDNAWKPPGWLDSKNPGDWIL